MKMKLKRILERFWEGLRWGLGRGSIETEVECPYCYREHEVEI